MYNEAQVCFTAAATAADDLKTQQHLHDPLSSYFLLDPLCCEMLNQGVYQVYANTELIIVHILLFLRSVILQTQHGVLYIILIPYYTNCSVVNYVIKTVSIMFLQLKMNSYNWLVDTSTVRPLVLVLVLVPMITLNRVN